MFLQSYSIPVKDVMEKEYFSLDENDDYELAMDFIAKNPKKEVFIFNKENLKGIITLADISKYMGLNYSNIFIKDIMKTDLVCIGSNESLSNCRSLMLENKIGRLPVVRDGKVVGIIREEHIRDYFYKGVEESELALKLIFDNIHEALCVVDAKGRVLIWNKNAEKLYGVKEEEIKGKNVQEYFPNAIDLQIFETKKAVQNTYHSPKEGYHVIISASPIIIDGKLYGIVSTEKDIVEVEQLQSELKKAKDRVEILEMEIKKYYDDPFGRIIGNSKKIQEKIDIAKQIARTNASVLLTGESGTGKEEFARAIHNFSGVRGNFIPVNCSAIPSELFESEFFGYEKGAFTGASSEGKIGFFEMANNGTIFLDEIGDLALPMQAKLLRVLQDKKIRRVGGEKYIDLDVRVVSATNRDLLKLIKEGKFREELYYRINVIEIKLPSLRERKEDVVVLFQHFLKEVCEENNKPVPSVEKDVIDILMEYKWEGNIRELKNVVQYMAIMCKGSTIKKEHIPKYIMQELYGNFTGNNFEIYDLNKSVENLEITLIKNALMMAKGNKKNAAKLLNIPRTTLHSKINKYNITD